MQELLVVAAEPDYQSLKQTSFRPTLKLKKANVQFKRSISPKREPKKQADWFLRASEGRTPDGGFEWYGEQDDLCYSNSAYINRYQNKIKPLI